MIMADEGEKKISVAVVVVCSKRNREKGKKELGKEKKKKYYEKWKFYF